DQALDHAAVLLLQLDEAGERRGGAEQRRIAAVDAGDKGVGKHLRDLAPRTPAGEGIDGFLCVPRAPPSESLGEEGQLAAPGQEAAGEKGPEAAREELELAVEEEVAVLAGGLAGRD